MTDQRRQAEEAVEKDFDSLDNRPIQSPYPDEPLSRMFRVAVSREERLQRIAVKLLELKPEHYDCEGDTWFGCPKSKNGCANDAMGEECNCGAEKKIEIYELILSLAKGLDHA